jgi:prepilin-type N-terminal cleavage/methylation domain-containing protein
MWTRTETDRGRRGGRSGGFSLLEVIVAIGILALCFAAIGGADSVAILHGSRYHGLTTASLLMRGIVMDIEAEYQEDGFPTNSITNRRCDVPRAFDDQFDCEYDLLALEIDPAELSGLVEQGVASFLSGGAAGGGDDEGAEKPRRARDGRRGDDEGDEDDDDEGGGAAGAGNALDLSALAGNPGMGGLAGVSTAGFDPTQLMALAPLFGPEGQAIMDVCEINVDAMLQRFMGMSAFFPMIVEEAAKVTRKLTVRLTWTYGPKAERELSITTFIIGLPEEEIRKMREAENLQEIGEDLQNLMSPDGGVPTGRGAEPPKRGEGGGK